MASYTADKFHEKMSSTCMRSDGVDSVTYCLKGSWVSPILVRVTVSITGCSPVWVARECRGEEEGGIDCVYGKRGRPGSTTVRGLHNSDGGRIGDRDTRSAETAEVED